MQEEQLTGMRAGGWGITTQVQDENLMPSIKKQKENTS